MRTIEEIKETICADFMRNESVAELFGFTPGDSFTSHFSKVSVIGILFYIFAVAAWTLEKLFDTYKGEVDTRIEEIIPHRPRWYRDKVLAFMKGKTLIADTDRYDTEGMTEDAIAAARVVKHAVAVENRDASLLTIKVAGEKDGKRCRLDAETEAQLAAYIAEIKDAGVRTALVNIDPDRFNCEADVYYDPMLVAETVENVGFITLHKREEDAEVLVPRRGSGRILILNRRGYGGVSGYDFWVNIPLALYDKLDITQVRAVVDAYKLASKRFSINYI